MLDSAPISSALRVKTISCRSETGPGIYPAKGRHEITQKDEILAIQLTENLQREDLNPIDQAKGIFAFIQAKHPGLSAKSGLFYHF